MRSRWILAVLVLTASPGCLFHDRSGPSIEIINDTTEPHRLTVVVEDASDGTEVYNETRALAAGNTSEAVELGEIVSQQGEYEFSGILGNGSRVSETISYADERGPDIVQFVVREDGLAIGVLVV